MADMQRTCSVKSSFLVVVCTHSHSLTCTRTHPQRRRPRRAQHTASRRCAQSCTRPRPANEEHNNANSFELCPAPCRRPRRRLITRYVVQREEFFVCRRVYRVQCIGASESIEACCIACIGSPLIHTSLPPLSTPASQPYAALNSSGVSGWCRQSAATNSGNAETRVNTPFATG